MRIQWMDLATKKLSQVITTNVCFSFACIAFLIKGRIFMRLTNTIRLCVQYLSLMLRTSMFCICVVYRCKNSGAIQSYLHLIFSASTISVSKKKKTITKNSNDDLPNSSRCSSVHIYMYVCICICSHWVPDTYCQFIYFTSIYDLSLWGKTQFSFRMLLCLISEKTETCNKNAK